MTAVTANSIEGQIVQLASDFEAVKKTARSFETHQTKSTEMLHQALSEIYGFGETLFAMDGRVGQSVTRQFITEAGGSFNKRVKANPFLALCKLAFPGRSESSISQYSTVLQYASAIKKKPAEAYAWLAAHGIKNLLRDALDYLGSQQRKNNKQARLSRLDRATDKLMNRTASTAVALPLGITAPEGFAIVLARIDGSNNAAIVDVLDTNASAVEPMLLRYDGDTATPMALLAARPLGQLFRAIDLLVGITPAKVGKGARDILIQNVIDSGSEACRVQAINSAYSFPGGAVLIDGHVGVLPVGEAFVLSADDAASFREQFVQHEGWSLDKDGLLSAPDSPAFALSGLSEPGSYRVAQMPVTRDVTLSVGLDMQAEVAAHLAQQRETNERQNKQRKSRVAFPGAVTLSLRNEQLSLAVPKMLNSVTLATTNGDADLTDRLLGVTDVDALLSTIKPYEVELDGWIIDGDVDASGLAFEVFMDEDRVQLVIPTRTGTDYNQVCESLTL